MTRFYVISLLVYLSFGLGLLPKIESRNQKEVGGDVRGILSQFLPNISGVIKIGNVTMRLPEDLLKVFEKVPLKKRSRHGFQLYGNEKKKFNEPGLFSVTNAFRFGCVIMDLVDISESAQNGLF